MNVQITHGPLERGKDLVFSIPDGFGLTQYCACVVKNTPITADHTKVNRLDVVLGQVKQAFESPFLNADAKKAYVSKIFLVCPHEMSQVTLELVKSGLTNFRQQLAIIDGPQLFTLLQKFYPDYKIDEFSATRKHLAQLRQPLLTDDALANVALKALQVDIARDSYEIYVQPSFEARVRQWIVDVNIFHRLVPNLTAQVQHRPRGSNSGEPTAPAQHYISINQVMALRATSEDYNSIIRPFLDLNLLSPQSDARIRTLYRELNDFASALLRRHSRAHWPNLEERYGERLIRPQGEFSDLLQTDLQAIEDELARLKDVLSEAAAEINEQLGRNFAKLEDLDSFNGLLESTEFQRALFLSDYFELTPNPYISERRSRLVEVDKSAFHGSAVCAFVVAPAGFGKTSFCRWHTIEDDKLFSQRLHGWISVYIALHKLDGKAFQRLENTIGEHARHTLQYFGRKTQRREGFRVYLDGLDEVVDSEHRRNVLLLLRKKPIIEGKTAYVVTSRDYLVGSDTLGIPRLSISPLSNEKFQELSRLWLQDSRMVKNLHQQLAAHPSLMELARIPLLGTLIILVFRRTRSLPENKIKLYETFIGLLCSGWDLAKGVQRGARHKAEFKMLVLRRMAFRAHSDKKKSFPITSVNSVLREFEVHFEGDDSDLLLSELLTDGVIHKSAGDLEFRHLSFQEYLAAIDLLHDPLRENSGSYLESYLGGDNWYKDVMHFYIQLLREPVAAVRWIEREVRARKISKSGTAKAGIKSLRDVARLGLSS